VGDESDLLLKISTSPASDSWGFVGVVLVGEQEAYGRSAHSTRPARRSTPPRSCSPVCSVR
jgi:hypothetical protein